MQTNLLTNAIKSSKGIHQEGFLDNLRRAKGAKTNWGGVVAGIAGVALDAGAGQLIWPGPGAVIGGVHGVLSTASSVADEYKKEKARKAKAKAGSQDQTMSEEEILEAFENWGANDMTKKIDEGVGKLIVKGLFGGKKPASRAAAPRRTRSAASPKAKDNDVEQDPRQGKQFRDPDTGRITPQFWGMGRVVDPGKKSMRDIISARGTERGQAHHDANYTPEAKARHASNLRDYYNRHPNVGEIVDFPKMAGKARPAWAHKNPMKLKTPEAKEAPAASSTVNKKKVGGSLEADAKAWLARKKGKNVNESLISKASKWINAKGRKEAVYDKSKKEQRIKTRAVDRLDQMSWNAHNRGDEKASYKLYKQSSAEIKRVGPRVKSLEGRMAAMKGGNFWMNDAPERPRDLKYFKGKK